MRIALIHAPNMFEPEHFAPYVHPHGHASEKYEYVLNPTSGAFDAVVVRQAVRPLERVYNLVCPPTRTLCALIEPPDIITLPDEYTEQFYAVACPDPRVSCKRLFLGAAGHHWFIERTAEQAISKPSRAKTKLISAVVSAKADTRGHRARVEFMRALKRHFGNDLDWFGRGVRDVGCKLAALDDYKYHIVLENGRWPHYWTEKLADAYMANCFPFYWGAPNASDYFDARSFMSIDPEQPAKAIKSIENAIDGETWETRQAALADSRLRVTTTFHPYELWHSMLEQLPLSEPEQVTIHPFTECAFGLKQKIRFRVRNLMHQVNS
jgi:hypothetical protein